VSESYPSTAFVLSLIAGIFILLNGLLISAIGASVAAILPIAGVALVAIGIVFGILVLLGALMMRDPNKVKSGATIVLVFSILSIFIGGGFFIGFILGIIGGALGLSWKPPPPTVLPPPPPT